MNKTVLITGGSSGIGLELCKIFAKDNYNLVVISQNGEKLNLAKEIILKENNKVKVITIMKNLSDPLSAGEIFDYTEKNSIQIDVLVNNAGVQVYGDFHNSNMEDTLNMMYLNVFALTKLTRLYVKGMVERGNGKILNLGSTGSFQPCPLNSVYCATKAFVLNFSEGIREELKGTGVTVTTLCPGATNTNFAKRANIENTKLFRGKLSNAKDVAEAGYKALVKNKSLVITGVYNKIMIKSQKFIPRNVVIKIGMNMMKKWFILFSWTTKRVAFGFVLTFYEYWTIISDKGDVSNEKGKRWTNSN